MAFINAVIKHDGVDISNSTISYNRDHQICTGVANLEVVVPLTIGRTFKPWDVVEIWENGNKKGKFYIDAVSKSAKDGAIQIKSTDGSKRLTDYFVTDTYTVDYLSYGRYWIEKFLDEAGVSYTFTVAGNGSPLSNNTSLGYDSAFSMVTTLLQQSGWYLYFDNDGDAIIGNLNKDISAPDHIVDATDIADIQRELDDDRLRNRAVVWGNSNPTYGEVFVDISVQTPWNYDAQDKRAVVLSNSSIYSHEQALGLAQKLLHEFTQIKDEKTIICVNDYNIQLGEIIQVNSKYWSGKGLVTGLTATMSGDGLVYQININKKCPRLFTFFSTLPPTVSGFYVYIGTEADGIWRKYTAGDTFSNDSSGLEDLKINDMAIRGGNFSAIADDGFLYTKTSELGAWNKYTPPDLRDINGVTYSNMDLSAKACSVNMSDNIIAGYNLIPASGVVASGIPPSGLSWVLEMTGGQSLIRAEQVVISGGAGDGYDFNIYDLESTGEYNIISVSGYAPASGYIAETVSQFRQYGGGRRTINYQTSWDGASLAPDSKTVNMGFGYGTIPSSELASKSGYLGVYESHPISDQEGNTWYYFCIDTSPYKAVFSKVNMNTLTTTTWDISVKPEWENAGGGSVDLYELNYSIHQKTDTVFDIVIQFENNASPVEFFIYHYTYTLGDSTLTDVSNRSLGTSLAISGAGIIGNNYAIGWYTAGNIRMSTLNLTSSAFSTNTLWNGDGPGYQGAGGTVTFFSTGKALVLGISWLAGTDLEEFYFFGSHIEATTTELRAAAWVVTEEGSSHKVGPVLLYSFNDDLPDGCDFYSGFRNDILGNSACVYVPTANTNLGKAYLMGFVSHEVVANGFAYVYDYYRGFSLGISYPDCSLILLDPADGGNWWHESEQYFPAAGSTGTIGHEATKISNKSVLGDLSPCHGKYTTPGWFRYGYTDPIARTEFYSEFRLAPAWGVSFGHYESTDISDCATFGYIPTEISDDLTGQLYTDGGDFPVGFTKGDRKCPPHTIIEQSLEQNPRLSGQYLITRGYTFTRLGSGTVVDNYPEGTILKHTSTTELGEKITATDDSLEQTLGIFEVIKTTQVPCKVDIAQGVPTVIYDIPKVGGDDSQEFWGSVQNADGSFYTHADPKPVYESRNFSLPNPGSFPTASGEFNPIDYQRYVGISNREGILASEYYLDTPWVNLVTVYSGVAVSGLITHFETSNFVPEGTYFFYTVSGVKSFYQKNPEEGYWRDFSATLPESAITIIRVDDLI